MEIEHVKYHTIPGVIYTFNVLFHNYIIPDELLTRSLPSCVIDFLSSAPYCTGTEDPCFII